MYEKRTVLLAPTNWLWGASTKRGDPRRTMKAAQHKIVSLLKTPRFSVGGYYYYYYYYYFGERGIVVLFNQQCITKSNDRVWAGYHHFCLNLSKICFFIYLCFSLEPTAEWFFYFPSELGAHTLGHTGLELMIILLSQPPKCWHG